MAMCMVLGSRAKHGLWERTLVGGSRPHLVCESIV